MKASAYPITIQVEIIGFNGKPMIVRDVICYTHNQLIIRFENCKTLYKLDDSFKIYFILNSKVNSHR